MMFLMKISAPMKISIIPPSTEAFPASFVPNFRPIKSPPIHIPKVTAAMIADAASAWG